MGEWKSQTARFPLSHSPGHSGRSFRLLPLPGLLEFDRTLIADRRVHSLLVVPEYPSDDCIFGSTHREKGFPVQAFDLQGVEQRLGQCIDAPMSSKGS